MEGSSYSDKRTQTLEALETFIQAQRTLLARQQSDIERLRQLRIDIVQKPLQVLSNLKNELDDPAFKLSEKGDCRLSLPKDVDWMLFEKYDSSNLYTYSLEAHAALVQKNRPSTQQKSPLSELQLFVKQARKTLVDPILAQFEQISSPEPSISGGEAALEEVKRQQEREEIRHLEIKKIQLDVNDENMEVDIGLGGELEAGERTIDDLSSKAPTGSSLAPITDSKLGIRIRQPTIKRAQSQSPPENTTLPENPPKGVNSERKPKYPKPKPETYKQSWSVSEQNLLEQLLEEIPDGEKFRWQKISRAMGGKRTPRQVASRVQKYFEKLKKFGIGIS